MSKKPTPAPVVPQVLIKVDPYKPKGQQCIPDPAFAVKGNQPTTFVFILENSSIWQWQGTSPVVVPGGGNQFPFPSHVQPSAGAVVLHDNNDDKKQYKYEVTVSNKLTGEIVFIDPIIQNQ